MMFDVHCQGHNRWCLSRYHLQYQQENTREQVDLSVDLITLFGMEEEAIYKLGRGEVMYMLILYLITKNRYATGEKTNNLRIFVRLV